jgi:hypothetical protein
MNSQPDFKYKNERRSQSIFAIKESNRDDIAMTMCRSGWAGFHWFGDVK